MPKVSKIINVSNPLEGMHTENRSDRTKCPEPLKSIGHNVLTRQKQSDILP